VTFANSERVLDDLLARRADIAVLPDVAPDARLHAVPIRRDRLVVFVARGHPWARRRSLAVAELEGCDLVLREPGSATRALFERVMRQAKVQPGSVLEIGSREAVREAVAAGLGVGVVSQGEFGHDGRLHSLALRDVPVATVEYAACLASRQPLSALRAFFALLREDDTLATFGTQTVESSQ
jgi:DNA-binding transcriptional LysR family regulator